MNILRAIRRIFHKTAEDEITVYASMAAFFIIIAFFPSMMLLLSCIQTFPQFARSHLNALCEAIMPDMVAPYVEYAMDDLYLRSRNVMASVTALLSVWSASIGMMAIEKGLNRIYEAENTHSYLFRKLVSMLYTVLFLTGCILSQFLLVLGNMILQILQTGLPRAASFLQPILDRKTPFAALLLVLLFTGLYTIIPSRRHSIRSQLPGALFSAAGWLIFSKLFSLYFTHFADYSRIYGSLAGIVLLMLWLYICLCILFYGAEINYLLELHRILRLQRKGWRSLK